MGHTMSKRGSEPQMNVLYGINAVKEAIRARPMEYVLVAQARIHPARVVRADRRQPAQEGGSAGRQDTALGYCAGAGRPGSARRDLGRRRNDS